MKHLISLSLKYIRRQKLRSLLTFLCITLSVFILNTASAYFSSIYQSAINTHIATNGGKEIDLTHMLIDSPKDNALDIIQNHVTVKESFYSASEYLSSSKTRYENGEPKGLTYLQITLDGRETKRTFAASHYTEAGDPEFAFGANYNNIYNHFDQSVLAEHNAAIVPEWFQDYGYKIGDTVSISISNVRASLSEDSEQVKAARALLETLNKDRDRSIVIEDDPDYEENKYNSTTTLMGCMMELYTLDEIEFSDEQSSEPYQFIVHIAGFAPQETLLGTTLTMTGGLVDTDALYLYTSPDNDIDLTQLEVDEAYSRSETVLYASITDNIDFDAALVTLLHDLGLEDETKYLSRDQNRGLYNEMLLALELKGADAITTLIPYIVILIALIVVLWFVARFVIDNAFEISVQERSSQFAVLRIMGASRAQLTALIFTEAIFYCITAVPIGVCTAFGSCKLIMERFHNMGLEPIVFAVNPIVTLIGLVLTITAIFISAYTSAIWASRKLSPLEALQYGKPRKKAKLQKAQKRRLDRKAKGFIVRYTLKNMLRTKQRFFVAGLSMLFGVALFSASALSSITFNTWIKAEMAEEEFLDDMTIYITNRIYPKAVTLAQELTADTDVVSLQYTLSFTLPSTTGSGALRMAMMPDVSTSEAHGYWNIGGELVTRKTFEESIEPYCGFSYDEFVASGSCILYCDPYGNGDGLYQIDAYGKREQIVEYGWYSAAELGAPNATLAYLGHDPIPVSGAICMENSDLRYSHGAILLPTDTKLIPETIQESRTYLHFQVNGSENYEEAKEIVQKINSGIEVSHYMNDEFIATTGLAEAINTIITAAAILLFCIWLVGVLSMVNSVNTSVLNRQNELIMMRAVGMTRKQLNNTVMLESLLFSGISTVIGLILGIGGFIAILGLMSDQGNVLIIRTALLRSIPLLLGAVLLILALNIGIAILSSVPGLQTLSRRLKRVD